MLNLFLGWTFIGWVIAIAWAFTADTEKKPVSDKQPSSVFRPDGMVGDVPYRVLSQGEIEAMIQGGMVRFQNLDQLRSMMNVKGPAVEPAIGPAVKPVVEPSSRNSS